MSRKKTKIKEISYAFFSSASPLGPNQLKTVRTGNVRLSREREFHHWPRARQSDRVRCNSVLNFGNLVIKSKVKVTFSQRAPRLPASPPLITFHFEALVVYAFGQMCFMCKILHIGQLKGLSAEPFFKSRFLTSVNSNFTIRLLMIELT